MSCIAVEWAPGFEPRLTLVGPACVWPALLSPHPGLATAWEASGAVFADPQASGPRGVSNSLLQAIPRTSIGRNAPSQEDGLGETRKQVPWA